MAHVRRVITGHDAAGRAIIVSDDTVEFTSMRPNTAGKVIWASQGFPADNTADDASGVVTATTLADGIVFRVVEFAPGNAPRMHRTTSLDYAVVLAGEIDMELDEGLVHLRAGDVLVQRGTIHNWVNRGIEPCRIAFILIDAKPVTAGGKVLNAVG